MKPVAQRILHDPENGQYGDCMRATIASLLELPSEQVPHFYEKGTAEDFDATLREFLQSLGYALLNLSYWEWKNFPDICYGLKAVHHMISGPTERGTYHAVVGCDGEVAHDPHPSNAGLLEDKTDWHFSFLIKL